VLRGYEADEGHELLGAAEAAEVADLGDERERGQRVALAAHVSLLGAIRSASSFRSRDRR
jgi:hypothetical protein